MFKTLAQEILQRWDLSDASLVPGALLLGVAVGLAWRSPRSRRRAAWLAAILGALVGALGGAFLGGLLAYSGNMVLLNLSGLNHAKHFHEQLVIEAAVTGASLCCGPLAMIAVLLKSRRRDAAGR